MYFFFYYFLSEIFPLSILLLSTYIRPQAPSKAAEPSSYSGTYSSYTPPSQTVYQRYSAKRMFNRSRKSEGDDMHLSVG